MIAQRSSPLHRHLLAALFAGVAVCSLGSPALAGCPPEPWPQGTCGSFAQSSLVMDAFGHFDWRASQGPATATSQFTDPTTINKICAWDEEHLIVAADVPADADCDGAPCWNDETRASRSYQDDAGANGDVRSYTFTGSDSAHTKLRVQTMVIGGIILPVSGGMIVQIVRTDTEACLESFLPADSFTIDDKGGFAAKFNVVDAK